MDAHRGYVRMDKDEIQYILDNAYTKSPKEIADWIGCTEDAVRYQLKKHGIKTDRFVFWNAERLEHLIQMYESGLNAGQIADIMKVSRQSVYLEISMLRRKGHKVSYKYKYKTNGVHAVYKGGVALHKRQFRKEKDFRNSRLDRVLTTSRILSDTET